MSGAGAGAARVAVVVAVGGLGGLGTLGVLGYRGLVSGALAPDTGVGRRLRELGPLRIDVAAPREIVFDIIAAPYLERTPWAMAGKLEVIERGSDLVLAAHYTPLSGGRTATTVETVRFTRPSRVDFRLVRGPVPHVVETFELTDTDAGTRLAYTGELGTDFGRVGQWWGDRVAPIWVSAVRQSFESVRTEAERRTAGR